MQGVHQEDTAPIDFNIPLYYQKELSDQGKEWKRRSMHPS